MLGELPCVPIFDVFYRIISKYSFIIHFIFLHINIRNYNFINLVTFEINQ